jgi:sulfite exporter TauE/SafE
MELWTAFLLGFLGSAHCAGMCGPLAIALPVDRRSRSTLLAGRLAYNFGRLATYCTLGAVIGLIGGRLALAGVSRWVSLIAGTVILLGLFTSRRALSGPIARYAGWVRMRLGYFLKKRTLTATFLTGMLNGLLPCGLVYTACAAAVTSRGTFSGIAYMFLFWFGTVPMMLGIGLVGANLQFALRLKLQKWIPVSLLIVGTLLVLRGMALGIPYVSPDAKAQCSVCCEK